MANKILLCLLFFGLTATSCTPEARLRRLLKKNPQLVKSDTLYRSDTVFIKGGHVDTAFYFFQKDTVVIKGERITQRYYFNKDSTIYMACDCEPDTIVKQVPVIVNKVQPPPKQKGPMFWEWIGICFALVIATFLGTKVYEVLKNRRRRNEN